MPLPPAEAARNLFVRRWGEMGASWGISRTMAEIHALLYLSTEPLCADDIMDQLAVSRGSTSMNLRELVKWGLVDRVHRRGDRKEYFTAEHDVWSMFETILRERRRREVQPIVETMERCLAMTAERVTGEHPVDHDALEANRKRYTDILEFCQLMTTLFNLFNRVGSRGVRALARSATKLAG